MPYLTKHAVTLALDVGLDKTVNGELIKQAEARGFEGFVTSDKNLSYQQNLKGRKLAIVVLPVGRWPLVKNQLREVVDAVDAAMPGSFNEIPFRGVKPPRP